MLSILALALASSAPQDAPLLPRDEPIRFGDDAANEWAEPFFPGANYDASVADPSDMLGAPIGSRLASHAEIAEMLRAIAETSPRVTFEPYGVTHEGRELAVCIITSPENHARLDEIQRGARALFDAKPGADVEALVRDQPGIAWMGYGIHGDETSASEAAVPFAYHLAAATDPDVAAALESTVVVLDPCLNPDGRERIRSMVLQSAGYRANLDNDAMQRGRWPGGRGNHYLFDMNRDWMAGETPETRARWAVLLRFPPQLFVDAHEMSGLDTFLFYPQAAPRNRNLPERLYDWQSRLARDAGDAFDRYGWGYYTREWADALYPGYSDAWGSLTGAIGMLYEQGRTIGAPLRRESGEIVAYRMSVHGQIVASHANFLTFAENRESILRDYVQHRMKSADPSAEGGDRAFVFVPTGDPMRDARFLRTLLSQGIVVERAREEFEARDVETVMGETLESATFPGGSYIVPAAQGQGALVRTYLELDPKLDEEFLTEERESIERGRGSKVYDVSAWNLARQYGLVDSAWVEAPSVATVPAEPLAAPRGPVGDLNGAYAWTVDGRDERALRFAARAMELGLQVHVSDRDFESDVLGEGGERETRGFPRGSFLLRRHENPDDSDALIDEIARASGARVFAVASGRAPGEGPDLGGGHFELMKAPEVALLSNTPVSSTGCGHVWRYLDEELRVPVTLVDAQSFRRIDLSNYNVFVLPPGAGAVVSEHEDRLAEWVRAGGTLVAIGSSAFALAKKDSKLSSNRLRRDVLEELDAYAWRAANERAAHEIDIDLDEIYGGGDPADESRAEVREGADSDLGNVPQVAGDRRGAGDAQTDGGGANDRARESDAETGAPGPEDLDGWRRRFSPAGVILRGEVDTESWLTIGIENREIPVLFAGSRVLMAEERPAIRLAPAERLRLGGLVWPEARARIADSAWLVDERRGKGRVISFAASPVYRGSWRGTCRLLGNAVLLGVR